MIDTHQHILSLLLKVTDPVSNKSLAELNAVSFCVTEDQSLSLTLTLGYPGERARHQLELALNEALRALPNINHIEIKTDWKQPVCASNASASHRKTLPGVAHIIAIASGKGGVGKSTTTSNLALALKQLGARVGILDADIYGPSQALMLGSADQRPNMIDEKTLEPINCYGLQCMSIGYLLTEKTPAVWRGPMATGALQQLLFQTRWNELDYLLVDMPPGTGDIHLTLAQQVALSGSIIVTTPQDIALLDAQKAIEMFRKVDVPILGIVENMSLHHCSQCGHEESIFGEGGGERIAKDYQCQLLGALPLDRSIREHADQGKPSLISDPNGAIANRYIAIAQHAAANLWINQLNKTPEPEITISDD